LIDLVSYGGGNIGSVRRALERMDMPHRLASCGDELDGNPMILPGVGSFGAVMRGLRERGLDKGVRSAIAAGTPYLGICVGLQILFGESEENPGVPGLGIAAGRVVRFRAGKVPQIGWNRVLSAEDSGYPNGYAYFVNSFYPRPADPVSILYTADYGGDFCAGYRSGAVTAVQFHPEKSGSFGAAFLRRWFDAL
jgi:imidazole glycerol-phosphate synthase subunit HisH